MDVGDLLVDPRPLPGAGRLRGRELPLIADDGERERPFGRLDGLALYLDGMRLADEVNERYDADLVAAELEGRLGERGRLVGNWQGPEETALYAYGPSFRAMAEAAAELVAKHPLCEGAREVQIA